MILNINAQVTADLSAIGKSAGTVCEGTLTYNSIGQPDMIRFTVDAPATDVLNRILNENLASALAGVEVSIADGRGRLVMSKLAAFTKAEPGRNDVALTFVLNKSETSLPSAADHPVHAWSFGMSNVHLNIGDERVEHPAPRRELPPGVKISGGFSISAIRFNIAGREWRLVDTHFRMTPDQRKALTHEPVQSGRLTVAANQGENLAAVSPAATAICYLLTLALSRDVKIVSASGLDEAGNLVHGASTPYFVHPSGIGHSPVVDNDEYRMLAGFVESAYPVYAGDPEWWAKTIGLFFESRATSYIDVASTTLNVLLDRLTTKVVGDADEPQIDAGIDTALAQAGFKDELHAVLQKLSAKWDVSRTDAIISKIREFNARPSFPKKVQAACRSLDIAPPATKAVAPRHKLLHLGELIATGGADYWRDLDALVVQMLLRMLGHDGLFYHFKYGASSVSLADTRKVPVDALPQEE
jgi:hypothetical protein